jgi:uncharacterized protein YifE (UPF0438 family)
MVLIAAVTDDGVLNALASVGAAILGAVLPLVISRMAQPPTPPPIVAAPGNPIANALTKPTRRPVWLTLCASTILGICAFWAVAQFVGFGHWYLSYTEVTTPGAAHRLVPDPWFQFPREDAKNNTTVQGDFIIPQDQVLDHFDQNFSQMVDNDSNPGKQNGHVFLNAHNLTEIDDRHFHFNGSNNGGSFKVQLDIFTKDVVKTPVTKEEHLWVKFLKITVDVPRTAIDTYVVGTSRGKPFRFSVPVPQQAGPGELQFVLTKREEPDPVDPGKNAYWFRLVGP